MRLLHGLGKGDHRREIVELAQELRSRSNPLQGWPGRL
jgi:hypothetical protein